MKRMLFLFLMFSFCSISFGQTSIRYYYPAGDDVISGIRAEAVIVNNRELQCTYIEVSTMANRINNNGRSQFEQFMKSQILKCEKYVYNSSMSSSKMDVYRKDWTEGRRDSDGWYKHFHVGYYYIAISKDRNSMIMWKERDSSSELIDKTEYISVSIDDILDAFTPKRDFLYE